MFLREIIFFSLQFSGLSTQQLYMNITGVPTHPWTVDKSKYFCLCLEDWGIGKWFIQRQETDIVWMELGFQTPVLFIPYGVDAEQDPVGAMGLEAFLPPPPLDYRKQTSLSLHGLRLSSRGQIPILANQGRQRMQRQGRNSQVNSSAALGQGPGSPSRDKLHNVSELFATAETSPKWGSLRMCCPLACRLQTTWNQKVDDADSWLPHH